MPKEITVFWMSKYKNKNRTDIFFDEEEVLAAFKKLSSYKNSHEMQLQIEISEKTGIAEVFLRDSQYILKLEKIRTQIFNASDMPYVQKNAK